VRGDSFDYPDHTPWEPAPRRARRRQEDEALVTVQQIGFEALTEVVWGRNGGKGSP